VPSSVLLAENIQITFNLLSTALGKKAKFGAKFIFKAFMSFFFENDKINNNNNNNNKHLAQN